jgi:hypothetical protein
MKDSIGGMLKKVEYNINSFTTTYIYSLVPNPTILTLLIITDHEMYISSNGERVHPVHWTKIWATRVVPTPSVQNLPKPRPQRPTETSSSSSSSVHSINRSYLNNHNGEPVARPPTPSPYAYTIENVIG